MVLLDPFAAASCELKAFYFSAPDTPPASHITQPGRQEFIAETLTTCLRSGGVDLRDLRSADPVDQQRACLAAMDDGARIIVGGLLPPDTAGRRTGRADLLVRTPQGYLPGLVRMSGQLDQRRDKTTADLAPLTSLDQVRPAPGWAFRWHHRWRALLPLAHLYRMLQALGRADSAPQAILVGTDRVPGLDRVAVRLDLDLPNLPPMAGHPDDTGRSPLERYDLEFGRRLELSERGVAGSGAPLPVLRQECRWCGWQAACLDRLDPEDLSLSITKSPLDPHEIGVLRECGVFTISDLAEADLEPLLERFLPQVGHRAGAETRLRLAHHRCRLLHRGVELERVTTGPIDLPGAELEIDIDVETSADDRVYLWGFWINDAATGESGYHQLSRFERLDDHTETALATQALSWLRDRIADRDARVYHYSDYEIQRIRRLAERHHTPALEWATSFADRNFVDLYLIMRRHFFGAHGLGLKAVASTAAGFSWRDPEPGGLNSLQWFTDAIAAPTTAQREQARQRVLAYNEDDVRATAALRAWLRSVAP